MDEKDKKIYCVFIRILLFETTLYFVEKKIIIMFTNYSKKRILFHQHSFRPAKKNIEQKKILPCRESNPGRQGENLES